MSNKLDLATHGAASICVQNTNNVWIDDRAVSNCHECNVAFGLLTRKHHCRNCGNIFCYNCTNHYITIPNFITDRPEPADYWNPAYYFTSLRGEKEKVCTVCFHLIEKKKRSRERIGMIFKNPVDIVSVNTLPSTDQDVKFHYFDHLRNIQYYLPNHTYSDLDKKILSVNSHHFSGHSKYIVHLIKSIDWKNAGERQTQQILDTLTRVKDETESRKTKTCSELFCTRTCGETLSCDDCVTILYSTANYLPNEILDHIFGILDDTSEKIILCHLPFFINLVKDTTQLYLTQHIYQILCKTKKLVYHTFWFLNHAKEGSKVQEIININNFLRSIQQNNPELVKKMQSEYTFYVNLVDNLDNPKPFLENYFREGVTVALPYNPDVSITGGYFDQISVKSSHTKPVVIPFTTNINTRIMLMFKRESVMNDITALNLMALCGIILNGTVANYQSEDDGTASEEKSNPQLLFPYDAVIYQVMPITSNSGMIKIVEDAETLHKILSNKTTISNYIISKNENKIISDVLNRYVYSLVAYTLHSYFIGLGDRHQHNIMITDDGAIFHIDFGYIMGKDSYPLTAYNVRLSSDMLDIVGGACGDRYNMYLNLCARGIVVLRKYFNMFFVLLNQNPNLFPEKQVEKFILNRFQPRQSDQVVITELMNIIERSHDAYHDLIRDFFHYHTQEKTLQNGVTKVIKNAVNTIKNFTDSRTFK